jgi:RNA polymerase sigma factor (sigma-70 family)
MVARREQLMTGEAVPLSAQTFGEFYQDHWWPMLRLAAGLVDGAGMAEDVVQDAFTAMYRRFDSVAAEARASYLRRAVVNGSRSTLRKRIRARKYLSVVADDSSRTSEPADHTTVLSAEHAMARAALADLPQRQREVLTLRYIAELADHDIAAATGLSLGGVRSASSRGLAAMRMALGEQL